jgi:hypothetical protein
MPVVLRGNQDPGPYDRQLISDTFAIDDAFVHRTVMFQNGDWFMTSFRGFEYCNRLQELSFLSFFYVLIVVVGCLFDLIPGLTLDAKLDVVSSTLSKPNPKAKANDIL